MKIGTKVRVREYFVDLSSVPELRGQIGTIKNRVAIPKRYSRYMESKPDYDCYVWFEGIQGDDYGEKGFWFFDVWLEEVSAADELTKLSQELGIYE